MAYDLVLGIKGLRRSKVALFGVHKVARLHALDCHGDSEWGVRSKVLHVGGVDKLASGLLRGWREYAHRRRVARASLDLRAIGEGELRCQKTRVDKVVARGCRRRLTGRWCFITILFESRRNDSRVESWRD